MPSLWILGMFSFWFFAMPGGGVDTACEINEFRNNCLDCCAFTACGSSSYFLAATLGTFYIHPRLPVFWVTERGPKHDTLFSMVIIAIGVITGMYQGSRYREILWRAVEADPLPIQKTS